jgi:hypothetical protein
MLLFAVFTYLGGLNVDLLLIQLLSGIIDFYFFHGSLHSSGYYSRFFIVLSRGSNAGPGTG